jgi:hypothetical protein
MTKDQTDAVDLGQRTVSNDTLVRMEGFVKIMAMLMPAKGL